MQIYVGSFTYGGGEGITRLPFDPGTGTFGEGVREEFCLNASNLLLHNGILYATHERASCGEEPGGGLAAFAILPDTGALKKVAFRTGLGVNPAGICVDPTGQYLLLSHFAAGAPIVEFVQEETGYRAVHRFHQTVTALLPLDAKGIPGAAEALYVHPVREGTHNSLIHQMFRDPVRERYAYCNLGIDEIWFMEVDAAQRKLSAGKAASVRRGSGPRHLAFHPSGKWLYCNYERYPYISQFVCGETGISYLRDVPVLSPEETFTDRCNQSEILINRAGTRLYNLMRGVGTLTVFAIDGETGALTLLRRLSLKGRMCRCAAFLPDESYLLVSDTDAEVMESFRVEADGTLTQTDVSGYVPHPAGIAIVD